ncbi:MAG TPA: cytochrome P460 family protein, partial [bacterium]
MISVRHRLRAGLLRAAAALGLLAGVTWLLPVALPGTPRLAQAQSAPAQAGAESPPAGGAAKPAAAQEGAAAPTASPAARSAAQMTAGGRIGWGVDYRGYTKVTGYINSLEHGNRLVVTYVAPAEAAAIFRQNAALVRANKSAGFGPYPAGTVIVMEAWHKSPSGAPDTQGPIFFMRKEPAGFDTEGRDWFYGFTDAGLNLIAEGRDGKVTFCRGCH